MAGNQDEGKRARRVAETRARLIDVSLDLYVTQGFTATTVDQIAAAAGIGRSSFFRYFASKEYGRVEPGPQPVVERRRHGRLVGDRAAGHHGEPG